MKVYFFISFIFLFMITLVGIAQIDRSQAPRPGPDPDVKLGSYKSFSLKNGLRVYVIEDRRVPSLSMSLNFDNRPILEKEKSGYMELTGSLMRTGTMNRSKSQLDEEIDFIGATLSVSTDYIYISSLSKYKNELFELMTDVLYNPSFPQDEFDKLVKQRLSTLESEKDSPGTIINNVMRTLVFGEKHPYGELTTEETINNITIEDCKLLYKKWFVPNNAHMVIVGDIGYKEARSLVKSYFKDWKKRRNAKRKSLVKPPVLERQTVYIVDRPVSVQSEIRVAWPVDLKLSDSHHMSSIAMNRLLGDGASARLFKNLREDKGYTYGAYSSLNTDRYQGNFYATLSVRNEVTDSAITEVLYEINRLSQEPIDPKELKSTKNRMRGQFIRSLENPRTIASFALNKVLYGLDDDYYKNYLKRLSSLGLDDVQRAAQHILKRGDKPYIIVVGKADDIYESLKKFGEVVFLDNYANEMKYVSRAVPEGISDRDILNNYLNVIDQQKLLEKIEDIVIEAEIDFNGQKMEFKKMWSAEGLYKEVFSIQQTPLAERRYDGESVMIIQQGIKQDVTLEQEEEVIFLSKHAISELVLLNNYDDYTFEIEPIIMIDGNEAYGLKTISPLGKENITYYDKKTGLKIQQTSYDKISNGQVVPNVIEYGDYKLVDGILFPFSIKIKNQGLNFKVVNIDLNSGLAKSHFK